MIGYSLNQKTSRTSLETRIKPLLDKAISGDHQAYHALLKTINDIAKAYVMRKTGGHADCDDVVQTILLSVHKALPTYDTSKACMPWLAAIMHYRVSDWLRTRYSRHEGKHVPLEDVEQFLEADVTHMSFEYEYVNKAVSNLTDGQQAVIKAMYHEDLTVAETSEKLGMSVSAVKVNAHRAYKKLRGTIEHD